MPKPTLFVTIPAYNEADSISQVIQAIPQRIKGIKTITILVWDDGSNDQTADTARSAGADDVHQHPVNLGLATTFYHLMKEALKRGADIVVNLDADGQYDPSEIELLIKPILDSKADIVTGDRQVATRKHMPKIKQWGNYLGSFVVRHLTGLNINDASCGFRAYSKNALEKLHRFSSHTYTHETLIQAAHKKLRVSQVPVSFDPREHGQSRLIKNVWSHMRKAGNTIIHTILHYRAFTYLTHLGSLIILLGVSGIGRFVYYYFTQPRSGHTQSLVISVALVIIGFNTIVLGIIADLISHNRKMLEKLHDSHL